MGLFCLLLLSFGAFCFASATECVPATAKCSVYWEKILPHKNLIASEVELDSWCSKQARFYECLEGVLLEGKNGNLSYLPTNLLVSKLFSEDLCTDGSTSRSRLLSNADCINQLDTDFCILPEYLDIVTEDDAIPSTRCSQAEKTFSCIAATMVLNCGFDAGRVYRTMLKITRYSDEVCAIETSEGVPPCEERYSKSSGKELSEIYYGLFHKIGSILEEDEDNTIKSEITDSMSEEEGSTGNAEKVVAEALQIAIDNLADSSEECADPECYDSETNLQSLPCLEGKDYKPYMKNPVITEVFKNVLFYNYSGHEYATYWRQPDFTAIDSVECEHLLPRQMKGVIFRCTVEYRYSDPDCLSNTTVHEKVTPEFIRRFDPEVPCDSNIELQPQPEWIKAIDEAYEKNHDQIKSRLYSVVTKASDIFATTSYLLHIVSTACSKHSMENWYEWKSSNLNGMYLDVEQMRDCFLPDLEDDAPHMSRIKIGNTMVFLIYDLELTESIDNLTCSRLDECHQRGRGLWKCKIWPREIQAFGEATTESSSPVDSIPESRESKFTIRETTEPTVTVDGSSKLEASSPLDETIALVFSGDAETEDFESVGDEETDMLQDFLSMDIETSSEDPSRLEEMDSDKIEYDVMPETDGAEVAFQIMKVLNSGDSESHQVVYEVDNTEVSDSDILIAADGTRLLAGNFVLVKDISDLNEAKYTVVSTESTDEAV